MRSKTAVLAMLAMVASLLPALPALAQETTSGLKINEIDYDQAGTDSAEFVEIYNSGSETIDLSAFEIRFVNGADDSLYRTLVLSGDLGAGDFYVVCANASNTENCDLDSSPDTNFIQNGNPDALAIVETATGLIVDTVSYEGDTTDYTETSGAPADTADPEIGLSRNPDGADTDDNSSDFALACITPGEANVTATSDCEDPVDPPDGDPTACLFINEFHYDNTGNDTGEAIEVAGTPGLIDGYSIVLYNGNGGGVYGTIPLSGELADQADGHGTSVVTFGSNGIQNGSPDGIALVDPDGVVLQFISYEGTFTAVGGPADGRLSVDIGVAEGSSTPVGQSLQLTGSTNADFTWSGPAASSFGDPNADQTFGGDCPTPVPPPTPEYTDLTIPEIQGAQHTSPYAGELVRTTGVVVAVDSGTGYYLQDAEGDGDIATSDAIFVFDGGATAVVVGDDVTVEGEASEFTPGGVSTGNLSTTQISADATTVNSSGNPLPDAVVIGKGGRLPPTEVIEDDAFASFDPETDGIDWFESMEAMLVTVDSPTAVAGTSQFGEIYTIPKGLRPTQESRRGTLNISPDDYNPERVQIDPDSGVFDIDAPLVDTGARLSDVTGVVGYSFGFFEVIPTEEFSVERESRLRPERTNLRPSRNKLTFATYNVLNLDPNDNEVDPGERDTDVADGRFEAVARDIVRNLRSPDIVALQEIQDNSGADDDGITAADQTLQLLVDEIVAAGGPNYEFIDNPFIGNNTSGGQPGANIRVAYLYNPDRVDPEGAPETVVDPADQQVNPDNPFWDTRLPLVQTFEFERRDFTVVNNHFASKSGSSPLYGTAQNSTERQEDPAVNGSLDERQDQAEAVNAYLAPRFAEKANVIVLGDFNEFEFISPLDEILDENLTNLTLKERPDERYSYNFEGNSQSLDHILVSDHLRAKTWFDPVHINSEFAATASRSSDHDPLVAAINVSRLPQKPRPAYTLTVLHNNDGESDLLGDDTGAGSISRFGELLQDERRSAERGRHQGVVTLTSGDNFLASPEFSASLEKGAPFYDSIALDWLNYDVFTIGNHEFDFGPDVLADFISGIRRCERTPFLSANLVFDAEPALDALVDDGCIEPSTVIRRDGRHIGVIGLTTPELREVSSPGDVEILTNLAEIANEEAQRMTDEGIEIILLASHLQDLNNEVDLAAELSNIDAIIGGGGGEELAQARTATTADGATIPIVTVPGDYFDLGKLELEFDRDGELLDFDWDLLDVTGDLDQDWFLRFFVERPVTEYVDALDETVVATSPVPLNGLRADVRTRETNVGNLMADSMVYVVQQRAAEFGVELAGPIVGLQNGGGIRNDSIIPAGDITLLDTFDIAPFTNFVSVVEDVSAADLLAAVEHGLSGTFVPDDGAPGSFGQWGGLEVEFDPAATPGSRVVNLSVDGVDYVVGGTLQTGVEPVDLATIDFLAQGNDGYDMFETYDFTRLGTSYQQALAEFLGIADLSSAEYAPRADVAARTRIIPITP